MNKKRTLLTVAVVALLGLLVYLQVHAWKKFDWGTLLKTTADIKWAYVILSVAVIYLVYVLRAVRWRIFLRPMCSTTTARLVAPQFIGFAALALLGRPGEMVRPYLIAKKENVAFSSQVAIWLVERVFDTGSVALMFLFFVLKGDSFWNKLHAEALRRALGASEILMLAAVGVLLTAALVLRHSGYAIAQRLERLFYKRNAKFAHGIRAKIIAFTDGLLTIRDWKTLAELLAWSLLMWWLVAVSYWLILHAYGGTLSETHFASIFLLMVIAMFGSLIQLPGVGGGSQLATIAVLNGIFGVDSEIAVSCGMLLWLATFMSVIPAGLILAQREGLSLRGLASAEEKAEAALND